MEKKHAGLSESEAEKSRIQHGSNKLTAKKRESFLKKLADSFRDPIIKILLAALGVTLILPGGDGSLLESFGIAAAILIATVVSTLSEHSSENAFQKMQQQSATVQCTVLRNDTKKLIYISEIVVGDIIFLSAGDKIPADGIIIDGKISCDQSSLNGESKEQHKYPQKGTDDIQQDLSCRSSLFRGSDVTAGNGIMRVLRVGDLTYYGQMASEVQIENSASPLRQKLSGLAKTLSRFGYFCALCVAITDLATSFLLDKAFVFTTANVMTQLLHSITLAVSIVVVAVPEGLPMMITVVLSSNMLRMQKENVTVRKPVGIETAGSINILFTDKTGTITYGTPKTSCYVCGDSSSSIRCSDLPENIRFLIGAAAVHSSSSTVQNPNIPSRRKAIGGNGTDRAILDGFLSCNDLPKTIERTAFLPFDSVRKFSAASISLKGEKHLYQKFGNSLTIVKGAPELILNFCKGYYSKSGKVLPIDKDSLTKTLNSMTGKAMRVIAVATSSASSDLISNLADKTAQNENPNTASIFYNMNFVAFIGIRDELRREAAPSIKTISEAGIQTVMITGDNTGTAVAIAKEAGILPKDYTPKNSVLESSDLENMSDEEIKNILPDLRVVARALPSDKSRLVRIAKSCDLVVGMTGDGLNDAPALKQADVGFAMGSGTDVAKEAGDIIITDNNIASIVKAILFGRTIFRSIRKFIVFQLTINLCAVGISIIGPFIGYESPVTVMQMLWINIIMDTLAALAFAGEAPLKRYLKEPPNPKNEPVLNPDMITRIFVMGVYTIMLCLFYLQSSYVRSVFRSSDNDIYFITGFFALFVFSGILGSFNARTTRLNLLSGLFENPIFLFVMSLVFTVQIALINFGGTLFRTAPLTLRELKTVFLLSVTVLPFGRLLEFMLRKKQEQKTPESKISAPKYPKANNPFKPNLKVQTDIFSKP